MNKMTGELAIFRLVAIAMLFWALGRHAYGYYVILRWVVCGASVATAILASGLKKRGWSWIFAAVAVLFNPILPVHFDRDTWALVDVVVAILILASVVAVPGGSTRPPDSGSNVDPGEQT